MVQVRTSDYIRCIRVLLTSASNTSRSTSNTICRYWKIHLISAAARTGTLSDFSSALRDESMPRINNKGLVYADRTPKDVYHYYQAAGARTFRCCILPAATGQTVPACSKAMLPYLPVKIYTNLSEVELFIDGYFIGKGRKQRGTTRPPSKFHFLTEIAFLFAQGKLSRKDSARRAENKLPTPIPACRMQTT